MGGKKKQATRTKGNTRPSSSGRSAEKLVASGTSLSGFLGFSTLQGDVGFIPATQGNDELDATIDAEFRLVMRKMSKKDTITKLKAIQEFTAMCKERDLSSIKSILPFWPRIFNRLSMDYERRIREAIFQALNAIVCSVQKNIAPHLRSIMGCWLLGQCDGYGPAASAAKIAFGSAFPVSKQQDALVFCKKEILNLVEENLFLLTAGNVVDADMLSSDEREEKYVRIITSSLYALKLFLNTVAAKEHDELMETYERVLGNDLFWKYHKHKSSLVRSAWFSLVSALLEHLPELMQNYAAKLASIIFNNLDEADPVVSPQIWEAAMKILTRVKDCWQYINVCKTLIPKLRHILRKGGVGNASIIYPCVLPLIKEIPSDKVVLDRNFYGQFFIDFRLGLEIDKVKSSSSELNAIVNAFMECFVYVLIDGSLGAEDRELLLAEQLMPLVQSAIQDPHCKLSSTCLYGHLARLLRRLHATTREQAADSRSTLHDAFWDDFKRFYASLDISDPTTTISLSAFYSSLRTPPESAANRKTARVQFAGSRENSGHGSKADALHVGALADDSYFGDEDNPFYDCLCAFLDDSLPSALKTDYSSDELKPLSSLCLTYSSPLLFRKLAPAFGVRSVSKEDSAAVFFREVIFPWIKTVLASDVCGALFAQTAINFTVASYLSTDKRTDKEDILNMIGQTESPTLIEHFLQTKFYGTDKDDVFASWLKGEQLSSVLVSMAKRLCLSVASDDDAESAQSASLDFDSVWSILTSILSSDENFECMISSTCLGEILNLFHLVLPKPGTGLGQSKEKLEAGLEFVCDLASRIFENFQGCWQIQSTEELLLSFFFLACDPPFDLSERLLSKINGTLSKGIETLLATKGLDVTENGLFHKAFSGICKRLLTGKQVKHELVIQACLKLLLCLKRFNEEGDWQDALESESIVLEYIGLALLSVEECDKLREKLGRQWTFKAFTRETVTVFDDKIEFEFSSQQLKDNLKYLNVVAFAASLIREVLLHDAFAEDEKLELLRSEMMQTWVKEMLFAITFHDTTEYGVDSNGSGCCKKESEACRNVIEENLVVVVKKWDIDRIQRATELCYRRALLYGNLWSLCLGAFFDTLTACGKEAEIRKPSKLDEQIFYIQVLQAVDHVSPDRVDVEQAVEAIKTAADAVDRTHAVALLTRCLEKMEPSSEMNQIVPAVVDNLISWRDSEQNVLLFDASLRDADDSSIHLNIEVQRLMKIITKKYFETLDQSHRDFLLCGLYSWIQTCFQNEFPLSEKPYAALLGTSSCLLLRDLSDHVKELADENVPGESNISTEWNEFFSEAIFSILFMEAVNIAEKKSASAVSVLEKEMLAGIFVALEIMPLKCIEGLKLPEVPELVRNDKYNSHLPADIQMLLNRLVPLINSPLRSVQLGIYRLLQTLIPSLTKYEGDLEQIDGSEQIVRELPFAFHSVLTENTATVNSCIAEMQVSNTPSVQFDNSSYTHLMGYLLAWNLVLDLFNAASSELRSEYASYLQSSGLMHDLLANLFFLISEYSSQLDISRAPADSPSKTSATTKTLFSQPPSLRILDEPSSVDIVHLACQVFFQAVKKLPVLVRQWWNNQDKTNSALIDKITCKYITPLLCAEEFHHIQHADKKLESMMVRARLSAREVVATYLIDEVSMELIVKLSPNHPLGPVTVECGKRVGVGNTQWRNWMLQLNTFLIHQNGSILDGLSLWKRNVDKKFEGIEECYICFYILHGSNCQLPRQTCRTCKKKFHSACLYKWFYTSNQSTCPLCRNIFQ